MNEILEPEAIPVASPAPKAALGSLVHLAMLAAGAVLLSVIVWQADPRKLWDTIATIGAGILLFIAIDGFSDVFHGRATLYCFKPEYRHVPLRDLYFIRLTLRAYNFLTPTSGFGGEFVKAMLLRRYAPTHEAVSVVIIDKFSLGFTQFVMAFFGSAYVLMQLDISARAKITFWIVSAVLWLSFGTFLMLQRRGWLTGIIHRVTAAIGGRRAGAWIARHLVQVDTRLQSYHQTQGKDLLVSMCWQAVGSSMDIVLAWAFLHFVFGAGDWMKAIAIWSLGKWLDMMVFIVPAGLGTQELSRALLFKAIGYQWQEGVAFAIVLRINQLFWSLVGLGLHALVLTGGPVPPSEERQRVSDFEFRDSDF